MWGPVAADLRGDSSGLSETNINNETLIPSVLLPFAPLRRHFLFPFPWLPYFSLSPFLYTHTHTLSLTLYWNQALCCGSPLFKLFHSSLPQVFYLSSVLWFLVSLISHTKPCSWGGDWQTSTGAFHPLLVSYTGTFWRNSKPPNENTVIISSS